MLIQPAPLRTTAIALRSGERNLQDYLTILCDHLDEAEPQIQALIPESNRRERLLAEAEALEARFPNPTDRPPLYGIPIGVKDIFRTDGFATQAGSQLPATLFEGTETACVTALKDAGAIVLGKTVTTEFAYFAPGPTRNPHNLEHTPGGSSSGSAAAVAAGFTPLALGTQTIGSVNRPAAYCGVIGYKPTYNRIDPTGLLFISQSLDHVGLFTQDVAGMKLAASLLCQDWRSHLANADQDRLPVLGIPDGPYLTQAEPEAMADFEAQLAHLERAGYTIRRIEALNDIETIAHYHVQLMAAEMAHNHRTWFINHKERYRSRTAQLIEQGKTVSREEVNTARSKQLTLRDTLERWMDQAGIDLWVCPAAPGPAPAGIDATGNPAMNLPWTNAGMPALSIPAGKAADGLPLGLQCIGKFMGDEQLLNDAASIAETLKSRL